MIFQTSFGPIFVPVPVPVGVLLLMALQILRIRTSLVRLEDVGVLGDDD